MVFTIPFTVCCTPRSQNVVNRVLISSAYDIEYELANSCINRLAYANVIFLVSSTNKGMRLILQTAEREAAEQEPSLNTAKFVGVSMLPATRNKRCKVLKKNRGSNLLMDHSSVR